VTYRQHEDTSTLGGFCDPLDATVLQTTTVPVLHAFKEKRRENSDGFWQQ